MFTLYILLGIHRCHLQSLLWLVRRGRQKEEGAFQMYSSVWDRQNLIRNEDARLFYVVVISKTYHKSQIKFPHNENTLDWWHSINIQEETKGPWGGSLVRICMSAYNKMLQCVLARDVRATLLLDSRAQAHGDETQICTTLQLWVSERDEMNRWSNEGTAWWPDSVVAIGIKVS